LYLSVAGSAGRRAMQFAAQAHRQVHGRPHVL
jgi:hypothetical protein